MSEWNAHVTVATVVEKDDRFLLVEEAGEQGLVINQPAGHLEPGENLVQAAIREAYEETGWHISIEGLLGLALYRAPDNGITYHRTTFFGSVENHDSAATLDPAIANTLWLSHSEMLAAAERMRSPLVIKAVEQYLSGPRLGLEVIYHSSHD